MPDMSEPGRQQQSPSAVRGVFNNSPHSSYISHSNKRVKTRVMLFLNIVYTCSSSSTQCCRRSAIQSSEACNILVLDISGHSAVTALLLSNLTPPLSDFRGPNKCKSLYARSRLYSKCVRTFQPISAIFCVM